MSAPLGHFSKFCFNFLSLFCRNYQYGGGENHKGVKDLLRMESDDSDSELDIENSTTPDNLSAADGPTSDRGSTASKDNSLIKPEFAAEKPVSPIATSVINSIGASGGNSGAFTNTTPHSATARLLSHSHAAAMAAMAAGGLPGAALGAGAPGAPVAPGAADPAQTLLAAKNWLKPELHSFFMPFSAAAHLAHFPLPHHFNSQASMFHVKDSA